MTVRKRQSGDRFRGGFSLVELLVVISIMVLLMSVALPAMNRLMAGTKVEGAASSVASAASTARAYAGLKPSTPMGKYYGAAVVFTPANEMRIARHRYDAVDGNGRLLTLSDRGGYADMEDEPYVNLPDGVGVVGIARAFGVNTDEPPALLAPPFTIRFDRNGILTPGQAGSTRDDAQSRIVFYDHDNDGDYQINSSRPNNYDPDEWDPEVVGKTNYNWFADNRNWGDGRYEEKYLLPFGRLDSVVGVIVYDKGGLRRAGHNLVRSSATTGVNEEARDWIYSNGIPVFFNRYSGAAIKP